MDDPKLLRLHPQDNVLVSRRRMEAGEPLQFGDDCLILTEALPLGFKIAGQDLPAGERVIKYGVPIGSTRTPITRGEVVHLHNLKSDYLPTFTRGEEVKQ